MGRKRRGPDPSSPEAAHLAALMRDVAAPAKLALLAALAEGELAVGPLALRAGLASASKASEALAALRRRALVESRPEGTRRVYRLTAAGRRLAGLVDRLLGRA